MAAATVKRARALVFRLPPEDQVELAEAIVGRVTKLPGNRSRKRLVTTVGRKVDDLATAIGSPLDGRNLDARLAKAKGAREKGIPASTVIKKTRERLGL